MCANKNKNIHNYVININNFDPKPTCDLHPHSKHQKNSFQSK